MTPPVQEVEIFNPTVAELNKIVSTAKELVITDYKDKAQVEIVSAKRKELKKIRVAITARGKELREEALAHQRKVIEKEKELVGIITPEEERLQQLEDDVAMQVEKDRRLGLLPDKLAMLRALGMVDITEVQKENLLLLTDENWAMYYNGVVARKNEADRIALEAREAEQKRKEQELEDEKNRIAQEEAERVAKAEADAKAQAEREAQEKADALKREADVKAKAIADAKAKEQQEKEALAREEKARADERARIELEVKKKVEREEAERIALEKKKIYQKFLADSGFTEETKDDYIVKNDALVITLYKKVNTLDLS